MPELPEVETLKQELAPVMTGKVIKRAVCFWAKMVRPLAIEDWQKQLKGKKITGLSRRAKILVFDLADGRRLLIHLKMTGQLIFRPKGVGRMLAGGHPQKGGLVGLPNKYTRIIFHFNGGDALFFNDVRKFGWAKLVDAKEAVRLLDGGLEPLGDNFSMRAFEGIIGRYPRRKIKQILLDQKLISGIGNIYSDEACFLARIRPDRPASRLKKKEAAALYRGIRKVLRQSIRHKGTSFSDYRLSDGALGGFQPHLNVYGRGREKCKRCHRLIVKKKLRGRGTHFCPYCQR